MDAGFMDYVKQGGLAAYPLVLCSVISIAIIIERSWYLIVTNSKVKKLVKELFELVKKKDIEKAVLISKSHPVGAIFESVIKNWGKPIDNIETIAERKRMENVIQFKKYVWVLGTVGAIAPFIGLMGTVLGIMESFKSIAMSGSGGFTVVSAGISEALIATAGGLVIAIYSVFAYNFFTVKINNLATYIKMNTEDFIEDLKDVK
ncbi:MAG: MotA/TolQ/ExbB proton channel family protein [Candidatus Ancaeobacter aquaticus]|nr:MotA/TolQ/ExbB proton channel family protein [Candidatus Ancaeobacter aquaticus]